MRNACVALFFAGCAACEIGGNDLGSGLDAAVSADAAAPVDAAKSAPKDATPPVDGYVPPASERTDAAKTDEDANGGDDASAGDDTDASGISGCSDPNTPPYDHEVDAVSLGTIDECDSSGSSVDGTLDGVADVVYYTFDGQDSSDFCSVDPTAQLTAGDARVCVFVACVMGGTTINGCTNGSSASSDVGTQGCCGDEGSTDAVSVDYSCGSSSTDAAVYIRVDQSSDACTPYTLAYHF